MNDDELDPEVLAALRDVAPASDSLRNQHIAAALAESSPVSSRSRVKWLSAAAAVIVLIVGGNALYAALSPSSDTPTVAAAPNNSVTTVPVKGSACGAELADYTFVGTYSTVGSVREVWSSTQNLVVVDPTSCAVLGTFTHSVTAANEKTCDGFFSTTDTQWVGAYSVAGTRFTLIATTNELQIRDGSCAVIASYPLPTQP
jgi:cation transporter-like permease